MAFQPLYTTLNGYLIKMAVTMRKPVCPASDSLRHAKPLNIVQEYLCQASNPLEQLTKIVSLLRPLMVMNSSFNTRSMQQPSILTFS